MPCTFLVCPKLSWVFQMPTSLEKWINIWQSSHPSITEFNQHFQDFPAIDNDIKLFSTPFSVNVEVQENVQLELIELQCDDSLRSRHQFFFPLSEFYLSLETSRFSLSNVMHKVWWVCLAPHTYVSNHFCWWCWKNVHWEPVCLTAISVICFVSLPHDLLLTWPQFWNLRHNITVNINKVNGE